MFKYFHSPIFEIMHYSFIIANRLGQIDLHFEPNAVFSDLNSRICFVPNIESGSSNGYEPNLFPYLRGSFKEMIREFKCHEYCFLNLTLIVVRSEMSNSARQGPQFYNDLEDALLLEIQELGFNTLMINAEDITRYSVNTNSIMGDGFDTANK
jgi:hypothetical protein